MSINYNDATVFFSTFGTIAQTVAGAFGLIMAVIAFRIQAVRSELDDCFFRNESIVSDDHKNRRRPLLRELKGYLHDMKLRVEQLNLTDWDRECTENNIRLMENLQWMLDELKTGLKTSLWWTVATLITSISLLSLTPFLFAIHWWVAAVLMFTNVGMAIRTIFAYVPMVNGIMTSIEISYPLKEMNPAENFDKRGKRRSETADK